MPSGNPKIAHLLRYGYERTALRAPLLVLVVALAGLLSSIAFTPAYQVVTDLGAAINSAPGSDALGKTEQVLREGWSKLVWGQLLVNAISAALLVPWSRAVAHNGLVPSGGGPTLILKRSLRSFGHLTLGNIVLFVVLAVGISTLSALTNTVGFIAMVVVFAGIFALTWAAIIISTTVNFAVLHEACDQEVTLLKAWQTLRLCVRPAATSFACLVLLYFFASALMSSALEGLGIDNSRILLITSGSLGFALSALHIATLTALPTFHAINQKA